MHLVYERKGDVRPFWFCESLTRKAGDVDEELANIDPMGLAPAVRHGVAPIMNANPTKTFWGVPCKEEWSKEQKKLLGCWHKNWITGEVKKLIGDVKIKAVAAYKPTKAEDTIGGVLIKVRQAETALGATQGVSYDDLSDEDKLIVEEFVNSVMDFFPHNAFLVQGGDESLDLLAMKEPALRGNCKVSVAVSIILLGYPGRLIHVFSSDLRDSFKQDELE